MSLIFSRHVGLFPTIEEIEEVSRIDSCIHQFFQDEFEKPLISVDFDNNELNEFDLEQVNGERAAENWNNRFEAIAY